MKPTSIYLASSQLHEFRSICRAAFIPVQPGSVRTPYGSHRVIVLADSRCELETASISSCGAITASRNGRTVQLYGMARLLAHLRGDNPPDVAWWDGIYRPETQKPEAGKASGNCG